jgi:hypothetical protein
MVHNILPTNHSANIILTVDFNFHLKKNTKYLEKLGFKGALSRDPSTLILGN